MPCAIPEMPGSDFSVESLVLIRSMKTLALALLLALSPALFAEENWTQFRGPGGQGVSAETAMAQKWDASAVAWKATLKGEGQSSVVNWGDKLFVTSATDAGKTRWVHCLDRKTGKLIWEQSVPCAQPEAKHAMNSWATASCVTDGERVIAFFGPAGIHCFDLDGKAQWSRPLGDFPGAWGVGASPVIDGDLVYQNCDATGPSSIVALNKKTGEPAWTTKRPDAPRGGWSTPILIEAEGRRELVLNGEASVNAYDPATGKDLWFAKAPTGRGEPMPIFANGNLYMVCGKPGNTYVLKPGGSGDVSTSHRVWEARRQGGRDLPSPSVVGDYVLISSMSGILTTYDAKTGETFFTERLKEGNAAISAAPVVAGGLVYFQLENGEVVVVKPGKTLEVVSINAVGSAPEEIFRASLSPIQGQWFARSQSTVYCIGK